jgi:hypothetical protein
VKLGMTNIELTSAADHRGALPHLIRKHSLYVPNVA